MKTIGKTAAAASAALALAVLTTGCGPEKFEAKTGGSEATMQKVQEGGRMYTPPPGSGVTIPGQTGGGTPPPTGAPR